MKIVVIEKPKTCSFCPFYKDEGWYENNCSGSDFKWGNTCKLSGEYWETTREIEDPEPIESCGLISLKEAIELMKG
jgi:hypothetical protein